MGVWCLYRDYELDNHHLCCIQDFFLTVVSITCLENVWKNLKTAPFFFFKVEFGLDVSNAFRIEIV